MQALDSGRINIAACSLGAARACLERAVAYLKERRQFDRPLGEFQALQFRVADMATDARGGAPDGVAGGEQARRRRP